MELDTTVKDEIRRTVKRGGDRLADLQAWWLGPGHLGATVSVYRERLARLPGLSHLANEVERSVRRPAF